MISLKKALAGIFMLAIIVVSFSCHNNSSSDFNDDTNIGDSTSNTDDSTNNNPSDNTGELTGSGIRFDLSNAKSFFAGNASSATASRSAARSIYDDNNIILMKITDDGKILPAMDSQDNNINFNINKILKNPATKELFLLGNFNKWSSYDGDSSWDYNLIKVAQDGKWHGLPGFLGFSITQEPFDESGNFYFSSNNNIYKYSGSTATKIVENAELKRVLPNGAIVYTINTSGVAYNSYTYVRLRDGKVVQLDDYSTSVYVKDKNIFYYSIKYISGSESSYYVDDAGNRYETWATSAYYPLYANKGGKKIYVTKDGNLWKDENGKTYDSFDVFSGSRGWIIDDVGKKTYLIYIFDYYEDEDGNKYDSYDTSEYDSWHYYVYKDGKKIEVTESSGSWKDSEGNVYDAYYKSECNKYYVFKNGKKIEVERFGGYYDNEDNAYYDHCDNSGTVYWVYQGGESVKVTDNNNSFYYDDDGNQYYYDELYQVVEYYVEVNGKKVKVTPAQTYSTDVLVAKYYDFIANEKKEAVTEADLLNVSYYDFDTSSENVFGTMFITNSVWKFEIQKDFSLKCEYNLSEKGYSVATTWNSNYNYIGENSQRYLEKFLYNGEKIYFLGTRASSWSSDSTYNLYKIVRFGDPQSVLTSADASNYAFNGDITFDDDGNFIGSVLRKSDGKYGILSGSMEYGNYDFQENNIFESVKDIVINFD